MNSCLNCNKQFIPGRNTKGLYCSRSCASIRNNKLYPKRTNKVTLCVICGKQKPKASKTCGYKCHNERLYQEYIFRWKNGLESGVSGKQGTSAHIRRYIFEKYNHQCSKCSWKEVNPYTSKVPLQLEHINGKWDDNREENLDLLCPNCHSLTPTYGALNKGNGREYRYNNAVVAQR